MPANQNTTLAPGVIDTIVTLAVSEVPGVAFVGTPVQSGLRALFSAQKNTGGVSIRDDENGNLEVAVSIHVKDGFSVKEIVSSVRQSVVDAVLAQAGYTVSRVDILIDGIVF